MNMKLVKLLNEQMNKEYYSAYFYLALGAKVNILGFKGAAHWLFLQAKEELTHGDLFYKFLLEKNEDIKFSQINAVEVNIDSYQSLFEQILKHEKFVTDCINKIADLCLDAKEHSVYQFIMWFVKEQVEEESGVCDILDKIKLANECKNMLLIIDNELLGRK